MRASSAVCRLQVASPQGPASREPRPSRGESTVVRTRVVHVHVYVYPVGVKFYYCRLMFVVGPGCMYVCIAIFYVPEYVHVY